MRGLCVRGRCMRGCACEAVHARLPPAASTSSTRRRPRPGARRRGASARAAARRGRGAAAAARRCRRPPVGRRGARRVGTRARVEDRVWAGGGKGRSGRDWERGTSVARSRRDLALATSGSGRRAARRRKATTFANCDHDAAPLTRLCPCGAAVPVRWRRLGSSARLSTWIEQGWVGTGASAGVRVLGCRRSRPITGMRSATCTSCTSAAKRSGCCRPTKKVSVTADPSRDSSRPHVHRMIRRPAHRQRGQRLQRCRARTRARARARGQGPAWLGRGVRCARRGGRRAELEPGSADA